MAGGIATQRHGSPDAGDGALVTWGSDGDVFAQRWSVFGNGGPVVNLGGACQGGGNITVEGPVAVGQPDLRVHLSGADPAAQLAVLGLAPAPAAPFSCGPCDWMPPLLTFVHPLVAGGATQSLAIPCQVGLLHKRVEVQWTTVGTNLAPCPLSPGVGVSQRLRLTIEY